MALSAGTRLGSYEILAPIGAGGMGEVYRARDTKLGRQVAIKVLPEAFSTHKERLARFKREARLLAALNHPNIATLYGLEESNGIRFLVMELRKTPPWTKTQKVDVPVFLPSAKLLTSSSSKTGLRSSNSVCRSHRCLQLGNTLDSHRPVSTGTRKRHAGRETYHAATVTNGQGRCVAEWVAFTISTSGGKLRNTVSGRES